MHRDPGETSWQNPISATSRIDTVKPVKPEIGLIAGNDRVSFTEGPRAIPISGTGESGTTVTVTISRRFRSNGPEDGGGGGWQVDGNLVVC